MRAGSLIGVVALAAVAVAATVTARRLAVTQERVAEMRAAVPATPEVADWPAEFGPELKRRTAAVRQEQAPLAALGQLTKLYVANGFEAEAGPLLETLRRLDPTEGRWPYLAAELRWRAGDLSGAEAQLRATVQTAPDYAPAWLRLGDLQLRTGSVEAAYQSYVRASHVTNDLRAQFALARLQAETGTRGDPRPRLTTLARGHPEVQDLHELLAHVLTAAGDREQAARERELAAAADHRMQTPDPWLDELASLTFDPDRLGWLGAEWLAQGRCGEAEALFRRAVHLAPADGRWREDLSRVLMRLERNTEARQVLVEAVTACPFDRVLPIRLAAALRGEHKAAEAAAVVRTALGRWPRCALLHAELGLALRESGEHEAAAAALRAAVQLDSTDAEVRYALAYTLLALRQPTAAKAEAEAAIALRPDFARALVMLGGIAVDAGDRAGAEAIVARLRELRPDDPGSRLLFAGLQLMKGQAAQEAGELDQAARFFTEGLAAAPDFAPLLREYGHLAFRRAQFAAAADLFDRYLRIERRDLQAYVWLGDALAGNDRALEARDVYERGLALARKAGDRLRITELSTRLEQ
jgi:tetratricopeptide (TPR) repeat protein